MPVLRSFDSKPVEEVESQPAQTVPIEAAQPAPAEAMSVDTPTRGPEPAEELMPWEEPWIPTETPVSHEISAAAGPAVTAEVGSRMNGDDNDLDAWESGIEGDAGQVVPAYGDAESAGDAAFSPPPQLNEEGAVIPQPERDDRSFPLDAFIIPPDAKRLPKGLEHAEELHLEIAEALAKRLEAVAQRLRREGFAGLLHHETGQEPIDTLLAGVLAGYLSSRADA
jgi:hypothetical protein